MDWLIYQGAFLNEKYNKNYFKNSVPTIVSRSYQGAE